MALSDQPRLLNDKTKGQLSSMIKTRSGISEDQAKRDVDAWMQGKQF